MLDSIHPFPARMAPEIAFAFLKELPKNSVVLDPMCGSGVALRSAIEKGHKSIGFDADPLAVLMSKVWTEGNRHTKLVEYASDLVERSQRYTDLHIPWHDDNDETTAFVKFWFAYKQRRDLAKLALAIHRTRHKFPDYISRALQIALSRLIVTKTNGASLAWDVAHSRPHIKKTQNNFEVMEEFLKSCAIISKKLGDNEHSWNCSVRRGDARKLPLADHSVDAIITSPPYLNAIDYMRGHRLSLVWLGYSLHDLRLVRSASIGSEANRNRRAKRDPSSQPKILNTRTQNLIDQYLHDLGCFARELKRIARPKAKICVITANSRIRGYEIRTNTLVQAAAAGAGLLLTEEKYRPIEQNKRYLPVKTGNSALKSRMMGEHIQYFVA